MSIDLEANAESQYAAILVEMDASSAAVSGDLWPIAESLFGDDLLYVMQKRRRTGSLHTGLNTGLKNTDRTSMRSMCTVCTCHPAHHPGLKDL